MKGFFFSSCFLSFFFFFSNSTRREAQRMTQTCQPTPDIFQKVKSCIFFLGLVMEFIAISGINNHRLTQTCENVLKCSNRVNHQQKDSSLNRRYLPPAYRINGAEGTPAERCRLSLCHRAASRRRRAGRQKDTEEGRRPRPDGT